MSTYRLFAAYEQPPLRRRLSGLGLALAVNAGLILILLTLGVIPLVGPKPQPGITINLLPESRSASPSSQTKQAEHHQASTPTPRTPPIVLPVKPTIAPPPHPATKVQPWVEMSKEDLAAGDISNMHSIGNGTEGDSEQVGRGPNGEVLYAADWLREPTNAELAGYLPHNAPDGYGEIACKTVPGFRVDDCIALGQSPLGSHLASAVLNAAWQFKVKPPMKGGHYMVGSWVRIRIDYSGRSTAL